MQSRDLAQLLLLVKTQVTQVASELRIARQQLQRAVHLRQQLNDFGGEYLVSALDGNRSGRLVSFTRDAQAFGQRLQGTASQQTEAIESHQERVRVLQQRLQDLQQRSEGLDKQHAKVLRAEQRIVERRLDAELEDVINARLPPQLAQKLRHR
jgi:flagellar biosynthesis chaperone FliJ